MMFEWILIVPLILWLVGALGRRDERSDTPSARRILEDRYARGEIDTEEFRARRLALEGTTASSTAAGTRS